MPNARVALLVALVVSAAGVPQGQDLPINTLAVDDLKGDIYAGTDLGPIVLRKGSSTWELAGVGFPEALMVDLKFVPSQRLLVAATHGLGIFYLQLP